MILSLSTLSRGEKDWYLGAGGKAVEKKDPRVPDGEEVFESHSVVESYTQASESHPKRLRIDSA